MNKRVLSVMLALCLLVTSASTGISVTASDELTNIALNKAVYASTSVQGQEPSYLVDDDSGEYTNEYCSEWCTNSAKAQYVAIDLGGAYEVSSVVPYTTYNQGLPEEYQVLVFNGIQWVEVCIGTAPKDGSDFNSANQISFEPIVCNAIKFVATKLTAPVEDEGNPAEEYAFRLVEMAVMGVESSETLNSTATFEELPNIALSDGGIIASTNTPWDEYMYTPSDEVGLGYGPQVLVNEECGMYVTYFSSDRSVDYQETPITAQLAFGKTYQINQVSLYPAWDYDTYAGGFPEDFVISVWNGTQWVDVITVTGYSVSQAEHPQIFRFGDITCNAVKLTALKNGATGEEYALCLSEMVVHGVEAAESIQEPELANWTIRDVSMTDGIYGYWGDNNYLGIENGTLENTRFSTIFRLDWLEDSVPDNEQPTYVNFWLGDLNTACGLVFQMSDITGKTMSLHWLDNGESKLYKELIATDVGLESFYGYENNIRLDVEICSTMNGTDIRLYFNGQPYGGDPIIIDIDAAGVAKNVWVERCETYAELYLAAPTDLDLREQETLTPQAYDLSDGPYLLTGNNLTVNDEPKVSGDVLDTPGNYIVVKTDGLTQYTQTISLYRLGDVDLNGTQGDADDFAMLKQLVAQEKYISELSSAESFAGDLNNDEKLTLADVDLLEEIIKGERNLQSIIDMYWIPALSFDYLGGDTVMPIGGFWGPNRDDSANSVTREVYQLLKDCGVNLITAAPFGLGRNPDSYSLASMKLAEEMGIGYMVLDTSLNPEWNAPAAEPQEGTVDIGEISKQLGRYSYLDNFIGINVKDEPLPNELQHYDAITATLNQYANINGIINAHPETVIRTETDVLYADYLQSIKDAGVKTLLYDYYPFSWGADLDNSKEFIPAYFISLNEVRNAAQSDELPFWGYVAAGGDFRDRDENGNVEHGATVQKEMPTAEETYWNVNTQLAFGAKGIVWFPLVQPTYYSVIDGNTNDYDRNGLIGADSGTTPFYNYATKMNQHIAAVDEVLMKAENKGVMVTGTNTHAGKHLSIAKVTSLTGTDILKSIKAESRNEYGALVGCFEYKNMEAYYVMNYDVTAGESQEIVLTLDKTRNYTLLSGDGGQDVIGDDNTIELSIGSGEAVLVLMWDESEPIVGDVHQDWKVNDADLQKLRLYLVGAHWCKAVVANINEDGVVDSRDIVSFKKKFMS